MKAGKAIFLDRDGVINKVILKDNKPFSPRRINEFKLLPEIVNFLNTLKKTGFINIVVTNQPDIARNLMDMKELNKMHEIIRTNLPVDDILVCPHDDFHNCNCRKPKAGMIIEASEKWNIDLKKSFMVGDSWKDVKAGKSVGCRTILVDASYNQEVECDYRVDNLAEAVNIIYNSANGN